MKILKYTAATFATIIMLLTVLFILFPKAWMKVINPVKFDIKTVSMVINNESLLLDFDVVITGDYLIDFFLDSIAYDIYFDSVKFSHGSTSIDKNFKKGSTDTLHLPLIIDRSMLKGKMADTEAGEKIDLRIKFQNFISLPIAGKTKFSSTIKRELNAPQFPQIAVVNVERKILNLHDAVFEIEFSLLNPNDYRFVINSIEAALDFKDLFTGNASSNKPIVVEAKSTSYFKADIDIDNLDLIRDGLRVAFRPNKMCPYSIAATMEIEQQDSTAMIIDILHESEMELMGRRKDKE